MTDGLGESQSLGLDQSRAKANSEQRQSPASAQALTAMLV